MSVMNFCITAWGGNIRLKQKQTMDRAIKYGNKLVNRTHFNDINDTLFIASQRKFNSIIKDPTHPMYSLIVFSSRSNRLIHVKTKTKRHFNSFLPSAVRQHWFNFELWNLCFIKCFVYALSISFYVYLMHVP